MVLLVVDIQKLITVDKLYRFSLFKRNVKALIAEARANNVEVIFVRHNDGTDSPLTKGKDGYETFKEFSPINGELIFDKNVNSPFKTTGLSAHLDENGEKTIMVVGLQTDYCIDATVKCGFEHGYKMLVPRAQTPPLTINI